MTKKEMIGQLIEWGQDIIELEMMNDQEIEDLYEDMKEEEEFSDDSVIFPNGSDFDSGNEEGI